MVERYVRDVEVAGSNPVISTKKAHGRLRLPCAFFVSIQGIRSSWCCLQHQSFARYHRISLSRLIMRANGGSESCHLDLSIPRIRNSCCCLQQQSFARHHRISLSHPIMRANGGSESCHLDHFGSEKRFSEPFSLTTVTRFLRGNRESGKHLLTACSYLFDNFGLRYKVYDCYRYDISYHIQD